MVATRERPTPTEKEPQPKRRRTGWIVAAVGALAALVVVGIVLAGGSSDDEGQAAEAPVAVDATTVVEQYAEHARNGDTAAIVAMWGPIEMGEFDRGVMEWRIGMGYEPELTECEVLRSAGSSSTVECTVTDAGSGFAMLFGEPIVGVLTADVTTDGQIYIQSNPPPTELRPQLVGFQDWLEENRPEAAEIILGDGWIGLELSREAGELSLSLLPEYQSHLATEAGDTPEGIMARFVAAVQEIDPELYTDLSYVPFSEDADGLEFLRWQAALGLDPQFSDCQGNASNVSCMVTASEEYFFATLANQEITSRVAASIVDNELDVYSWPPTAEISREETAFRNWIRDHHPDDEIRMFGAVLGLYMFGTESGELHMQYLDEYLAYRAEVDETP